MGERDGGEPTYDAATGGLYDAGGQWVGEAVNEEWGTRLATLAAERDTLAQRVEALEGALRTMVDNDASMPEWAIKTPEHRAYSDGVNAAAGWYKQVARDALKE